MYALKMGWERIFPLKIYNNYFKTWRYIMIFYFKIFFGSMLWCQFPGLWKITPISHLYYTYVKSLKLMEIGNMFILILNANWSWRRLYPQAKRVGPGCFQHLVSLIELPHWRSNPGPTSPAGAGPGIMGRPSKRSSLVPQSCTWMAGPWWGDAPARLVGPGLDPSVVRLWIAVIWTPKQMM